MDTVYFKEPPIQGGQTWLHCSIQKIDAAGVTVEIQTGYTTTRQFYPMHNIQKIEYGKTWRN